MKPACVAPIAVRCWIGLLLCLAGSAPAQNTIYGFGSPGFFFQATNVPQNTVFPGANPTLILTAGATYRLGIGTTPGFHPVAITTNDTAFPPASSAYAGAAPQAITTGTITLSIPATGFPTALFYRCNIHGFTGRINILSPPTSNQILSVAVTTNVILVSTGVTNTWLFVPEFRSNLVSGLWTTIPGFTNSFANGTNVTRFDRLDPLCGPNVFLRIRQSPPN